VSVTSRIPLLPAEEHERRRRRADSTLPSLWALLDEVKDPEIPVISVWELGILQDIAMRGETVVVTITPTYSGCPAMDAIAEDIAAALADAGYADCEVVNRFSPAWSTSWITEEAQEKLRAYGIAPPGQGCGGAAAQLQCPRCGSSNVRSISEFGSTACKALYQCGDCAEPFDHFKPI
jgi:ring-1,2-phenylacetyl-CoA epoxidase subunit PaaD